MSFTSLATVLQTLPSFPSGAAVYQDRVDDDSASGNTYFVVSIDGRSEASIFLYSITRTVQGMEDLARKIAAEIPSIHRSDMTGIYVHPEVEVGEVGEPDIEHEAGDNDALAVELSLQIGIGGI